MAQLLVLAGRETELKHLLVLTALVLFAEMTPRAGAGTSGTNGYWLITALTFSRILYFFFSSFYVQLEKDVEDYVPSPCKSFRNKLLLRNMQSSFWCCMCLSSLHLADVFADFCQPPQLWVIFEDHNPHCLTISALIKKWKHIGLGHWVIHS